MLEKTKEFISKNPEALKKAGFAILAISIFLAVISTFGGQSNYILPTNTLSEKSDASAPSYDYALEAAESAGTSQNKVVADERYIPSPVPPQSGFEGNIEKDTPKRIIKNGSLQLIVKSTPEAIDRIANIANSNGGFLVSSNVYKYSGNQHSGNISIKVPFEKFEATIKEIKEINKDVRNETVSSSDVTQEYVDQEARLKNFQAEEEQYRQIMKKAVKISDILEVQASLSKVRQNIEITQGRLNYLKSQTDMSQISATLSEEPVVTIPDNEWRVKTIYTLALKQLVQNTEDFIANFIFFFIVTLPSLIPAFIILLVFYFIIKKFWKRLMS